MIKFYFFLLLSAVFCAFTYAQEAVTSSLPGDHPFENLHTVNEHIYRSEQPDKEEMAYLPEMGVKTVINLRHRQTDDRKAPHKELELVHLPLSAARLSQDDLLRALKIIHEAKKPVLIHCWHGSDRTGAIIAAYRMVFENWPKEKAIEEFVHEKYGYHDTWFPDLPELLHSLEVEQIKKELGVR